MSEGCSRKVLFMLLFCCSWISNQALAQETKLNGKEMFFKQTNLKISIPLYIKTVNVLDDYPLAKFKLEDLRVRPGQKYEYSLKQNVSWLDLDQKGYLRFTYGAPKSTKNIPVLVKKSFGNKTRRAKANISVEMYQITSDKDVQNFCENRLCFWDNIQYRMLEGVYISNRTELIGDLAPHIYQHFCPNYSVEYKLWNASHLININGGKMYATGDWNYDLQNSPLHRLQPSVGCHINTKDGKWRKVITKTLDIIVVDLNDSPIEFVENKTVTEFGRKVDTFVKDRFLFPDWHLMAWDRDTVQVNRRLRYSLLNDTREIYHVHCIKKSIHIMHNHHFKTGIYCKFQFTGNGTFYRLHYCVTLQIKEILFDNTEVTRNLLICSKVEKLRQLTELYGPEPERMGAKNPIFQKIILETEPPFDPTATTIMTTRKIRRYRTTTTPFPTTSTTSRPIVTFRVYNEPPAHFPWRPANEPSTPRPKPLTHAEFHAFAMENQRKFFEGLRSNPGLFSTEKPPMRNRRAIADAEDLSILESNFKAFKMDCIVFTLSLGFFFIFVTCVVVYWWIARIQSNIFDQLCCLRLAQSDLEADLDANLCTEYRMRKGRELPAKLDKIATWSNMAHSCPELSWPSNDVIS